MAATSAEESYRSVTHGVAKTIIPDLLPCLGQNPRVSAVGKIKGNDGRTWTVPADTAFATGPKASDLYNPCNNVTPAGLEAIDTSGVPVTEVDTDGELITGYIFADNYFELYVNGTLVAIDPVPYTPSNSTVVRFKAKRPITYAVKLVDWEENLGVGTERARNGNGTHPGSGGFIARFSDGTVTDSTWKAQSFYLAPLNKPGDVVEHGAVHEVPKLGLPHSTSRDTPCGKRCYAVHYRVPTYWFVPAFDDKAWPQAKEFQENEIAASSLNAFTAFSDAFSGAQFIWSNSLLYDNLVLARKTVP